MSDPDTARTKDADSTSGVGVHKNDAETPTFPGDDEPDELLCPITKVMMRDPVFVAGSGNTYEREAIETYWRQTASRPVRGARGVSVGVKRDPLTNLDLNNDAIFTNWDKRREVQAWLSRKPGHHPGGMAEPRRPAPTRGAPEGAGRARWRRQRRALRRRQPRRAHRADGQARGVGRRRARGRRRALRRDHLPGALIRRPLKQVGVRARRRIIRGRSLARSIIIRERTSPRIVRVEETLPIHKRPRVQRAEPTLAVR